MTSYPCDPSDKLPTRATGVAVCLIFYCSNMSPRKRCHGHARTLFLRFNVYSKMAVLRFACTCLTDWKQIGHIMYLIVMHTLQNPEVLISLLDLDF